MEAGRSRKYLTPGEAASRGWLCRTELAKQHRLKTSPTQAPAGYVWQGWTSYPVFDAAQAIPMRPYRQPTAAQLEALSRGRTLKGTKACAFDGCPVRISTYYVEDDYCLDCYQRVNRTRAQALLRQWADHDGVVLDCETTGLSPDDQIIEICVIDQSAKVLLNTLVLPTIKVPQEATAIHGITDAHLQGAPEWLAVHDELDALIDGRPILAYNASFDSSMVKAQAVQNGLPAPALVSNFACAMKAYSLWDGERNGWGELRWHSLQDAARTLGIPVTGQHRALDDCLTTLALAQHMLEAAV